MNARIVIAVLVLILIIAIGALGFLFFQKSGDPSKPQSDPEQTEEAVALAEPYGTIILSLVDAEDQYYPDGSYKYLTYALPLDDTNPSLEPYPLGDPESRNHLPQFLHPANENEAFVASWGPITDGAETPTFQIFKYDASDDAYDAVTNNEYYYERAYAYASNTQKLAYMARSEVYESQEDFWDLDTWSIIVVDLESGEEVNIGPGGYPFWSPDGTKLLFLKSEGLHLYDAATESVSLEIPSSDTLEISSHIALSHDGSTLLWTAAAVGRVEVYDVVWEPSTYLTYRDEIRIPGMEVFWPVFSPDDRLVAFQTINKEAAEAGLEVQDPERGLRITIYDIARTEYITSHPLEGFKYLQAFTDDWIE